MKRFTILCGSLAQASASGIKISLLSEYFREVSDKDKLWAIALLSGKRPSRTVTIALLKRWALEVAGISEWLFEQSYKMVGDRAETIAKIIPDNTTVSMVGESLGGCLDQILSLKNATPEIKKHEILKAWNQMSGEERYIYNKLVTGGFRIQLSQNVIVKALASMLDQEESSLASKLIGVWKPEEETFESLLLTEDPIHHLSKPYPFYLAQNLNESPDELGDPLGWYAEYMWDGIRARIIKREGQVFVWSREEELVTDQYPEFESLMRCEDDFVLDGELVVFSGGIKSLEQIQKRSGKKKVSRKLRTEYPVVLLVFDLLEWQGKDLRKKSQERRRQLLEQFINRNAMPCLLLSELIPFSEWKDLEDVRAISRKQNATGLMLKSKTGFYEAGRVAGDWYKWKAEPYTVHAVLLYAHRSSGGRSARFSEFTFAALDEKSEDKKYVPFAKTSGGLTDEEYLELAAFIKKNTVEKFGPVHSVQPLLVFEISFVGITESKRHKCGIAVRLPKIRRWANEKSVSAIIKLNELERYILK